MDVCILMQYILICFQNDVIKLLLVTWVCLNK